MPKILYFKGGHQVFQMSSRKKSLYDRGRKLIHFLAAETIWANLLAGKVNGAHVTGELGQGVQMNIL